MATDSDKFITQAEALNYPAQGSYRVTPDGRTLVPLYEAKFIHQYDHRFTTWPNLNNTVPDNVTDEQHQDPDFTIIPRYYIDKTYVDERLASIGWKHKWLMGWRDITNATVQRTVISSIIPRSGVGDTFLLIFPSYSAIYSACMIANLNSFCLDYASRMKVGGVHIKYNIFKQLPIFEPSTYEAAPWFTHGEPLKSWIARRVVQLVCTSHDMEDFAREVAAEIPSASIPTHATVWNPESRFKLRCELDAAFFHLYGMSREETEYILDTFPIVRDNDIKAYGTYRTKDTILAIYDTMRYGM